MSTRPLGVGLGVQLLRDTHAEDTKAMHLNSPGTQGCPYSLRPPVTTIDRQLGPRGHLVARALLWLNL